MDELNKAGLDQVKPGSALNGYGESGTPSVALALLGGLYTSALSPTRLGWVWYTWGT